jgi:uncharacterized protein (DUF1800 family)
MLNFKSTSRFTSLLAIATLAACSSGGGNPPEAVVPPNSPGSFAFSAASYTVSQTDGSLVVNVARANGSSQAVTVAYGTTSGTATAGTDYIAAVGTLSWGDGDSATKSFSIPVLNTTPFSGAKSLTVDLNTPTGGAAVGSPKTATITINGSASSTQAGSLAFAAATYSVNQSVGTLTINVARTNGSTGPVNVAYVSSNGTATSGADYTAVNGTLNWTNGDISAKPITIPISVTTLFSGVKTFTVALSNATGGAAVGMPTTATVSINGSAIVPQQGTFTLSAANYTVTQGSGAQVITVTRTGGSTGAVAVTYATSSGTANAGTDFTATAGTLNWTNGDTANKTFSIPISNATPFQGSKRFTVALSAPTGGATLSAPMSATVTINGNPISGSLKLSSPTYTVNQSAGTLTINVNRISGSTGDITVAYATSDNSAKSGTDFTTTSGTLSWGAGDSSNKTISIPISNASPFTGNKTFGITLSSPTGGASLSNPFTATITISGSNTAIPPGAMGEKAAARLLMQGTFGAKLSTIANAQVQTYGEWFAQQAATTPTMLLPSIPDKDTNLYPFWLKNVLTGEDQLRQRIAFSLSEILVVSGTGGGLNSANNSLAAYYDILVNNAFGNYRTLLEQVTLNPNMGMYLSMMRNDKPNAATGVHADENYAREIMQLFSVGLFKLNLDGSPQLDNNGQQIPTYSQADVEGLARVFTGWTSKPIAGRNGEDGWKYSIGDDMDRISPMVAFESHHDTNAKTIIGGTVVPAGGTAAADLKLALDTIFNHPNVGPFISKQLIQKLVTSNPSGAYVQRVASTFNNNGNGVRGDLMAVIKAILTDSEAITAGGNTYGKLREPLLRLTNLWRAFDASSANGTYNEGSIMIYSMWEFAQRPLQSPSVFNFFRPDYARTGPITTAGTVSPEFQITNEKTLVLTNNRLETQAYQYAASNGQGHEGPNNDQNNNGNPNTSAVMLNTTNWEGYAGTPATLVDKLNLVFMAGEMPAAMKNTLVTYATGIPSAAAAARVAETASLVVNSPQYAVQR